MESTGEDAGVGKEEVDEANKEEKEQSLTSKPIEKRAARYPAE